jgi:hypothetical protein
MEESWNLLGYENHQRSDSAMDVCKELRWRTFRSNFCFRKCNGSGLPEFSDYFIPLQGPAKHTGALGIVAMWPILDQSCQFPLFMWQGIYTQQPKPLLYATNIVFFQRALGQENKIPCASLRCIAIVAPCSHREKHKILRLFLLPLIRWTLKPPQNRIGTIKVLTIWCKN